MNPSATAKVWRKQRVRRSLVEAAQGLAWRRIAGSGNAVTNEPGIYPLGQLEQQRGLKHPLAPPDSPPRSPLGIADARGLDFESATREAVQQLLPMTKYDTLPGKRQGTGGAVAKRRTPHVRLAYLLREQREKRCDSIRRAAKEAIEKENEERNSKLQSRSFVLPRLPWGRRWHWRRHTRIGAVHCLPPTRSQSDPSSEFSGKHELVLVHRRRHSASTQAR